jgi:di/tricarboxylate transporter
MTALVLAVFTAVYLGMALGRWPGLMLDRTGIALVGAILLVLAGAVSGDEVRAAIDVPTLVVLFGLMVLSAQFAACGFYAWCSRKIALTPAGPNRLLALTVVTAGLLSAVLANDVVVFAMTPMLATGLLRRGLDPRPFLIALASAANAGSAATIIGNPQNILIGQTGGLDFWTFLAACGPPAVLGLLITWLVVRLTWRGRFAAHDPRAAHGPGEHGSTLDRGGLAKALVATVALLALFTTPLPHVEGVLLVAGALMIVSDVSPARGSGIDSRRELLRLPVPRQQPFELVRLGPTRDHALEHVGQPGQRLDPVQLRARHQARRDRPVMRPAIAAGEQGIAAPKSDRPDRALDRVGVQLEPAVLEEQHQPLPVAQGIAERLGQAGARRDPLQLRAQPAVQRLHQRPAALLPDRTACLGRMAADLGLDPVQLPDPAQRLLGQG